MRYLPARSEVCALTGGGIEWLAAKQAGFYADAGGCTQNTRIRQQHPPRRGLPGFGCAMAAVKRRAGPRPIRVLSVYPFCICVESFLLCRVPHVAAWGRSPVWRPGLAMCLMVHADLSRRRVPCFGAAHSHGAWVLRSADVSAARRELVHGVLTAVVTSRRNGKVRAATGRSPSVLVYGVLPRRRNPLPGEEPVAKRVACCPARCRWRGEWPVAPRRPACPDATKVQRRRGSLPSNLGPCGCAGDDPAAGLVAAPDTAQTRLDATGLESLPSDRSAFVQDAQRMGP